MWTYLRPNDVRWIPAWTWPVYSQASGASAWAKERGMYGATARRRKQR
jgi:hypothetical protein